MTKRLLEMTTGQLRAAIEELGHPAYRTKQLADWVYGKGVTDAQRMSNVPSALVEQFEILTSRLVARADSTDGTVKCLLEYPDGQRVECVMIPTERRTTACLSTQIGCKWGCAFCATGRDGLVRNLTAGEILEQLMHLRQAGGRAITHVVFMGMGEPLANYDATVAAIRAIVDPERFGVSARHVTVSTVGLPKPIRRLAREGLPITLAISLHAPNDALRRQIVPGAATVAIRDILEAAQEFFEARKREVTIEYVLLAGVNDSSLCADALAGLARDIRCTVNVIRYNPVEGQPYVRPSQAAAEAFADRIARRGVRARVRRSRGLDATAACGQLRRNPAPNTPGADD